MKILITGGAGFIGSALVRYLLMETDHFVINLDRLTYAGNLASLSQVQRHPNYRFVLGDINDSALLNSLFKNEKPDAIMHLAAESHVDRSIDGAAEFIQTNVVGTFTLLESARHYWMALTDKKRAAFRFLHVSTDEVYGDLDDIGEGLFTELTPYNPSSPYSASKAASDHLVRAWHRTYGLPTLITNCSNNYGPFHFPEKLIPLVILNALEGKSLPIYGKGEQIRDWLFVEDHVRALHCVLENGKVGDTYNVGGHNQRKNIEVVRTICRILDEISPNPPVGLKSFAELITFVDDRPGHDKRYAIDATHIKSELGWIPQETFESGIRKTVDWYLKNTWWWRPLRDGTYSGQRLGLKEGQSTDRVGAK